MKFYLCRCLTEQKQKKSKWGLLTVEFGCIQIFYSWSQKPAETQQTNQALYVPLFNQMLVVICRENQLWNIVFLLSSCLVRTELLMKITWKSRCGCMSFLDINCVFRIIQLSVDVRLDPFSLWDSPLWGDTRNYPWPALHPCHTHPPFIHTAELSNWALARPLNWIPA